MIQNQWPNLSTTDTDNSDKLAFFSNAHKINFLKYFELNISLKVSFYSKNKVLKTTCMVNYLLLCKKTS